MNLLARGGLLLALLALLGWSLVAFGSVRDVPAESIRDSETNVIITDSANHVGERVVVSGTVAETDPLVVQISNSEDEEIRVSGPEPSESTVGDKVYVFGTLTGPDSMEADRVEVEKSWERTYMVVVSFLGGLIVFGRIAHDWRFDTDEWAFVPRIIESTAERRYD